jgi:hypothetical protein
MKYAKKHSRQAIKVLKMLDFSRVFQYNENIGNEVSTVTIERSSYESMQAEIAELRTLL